MEGMNYELYVILDRYYRKRYLPTQIPNLGVGRFNVLPVWISCRKDGFDLFARLEACKAMCLVGRP